MYTLSKMSDPFLKYFLWSCTLSPFFTLFTIYRQYTVNVLYYAPLCYGQTKNPGSVTFFNSVIKTPLLRTLFMDIHLLQTLFLAPEEKSLYYSHQIRISLYLREKTSFSDKVVRLFCHDEWSKLFLKKTWLIRV